MMHGMKEIIALKSVHKNYQLGKTSVPIINGVDVSIRQGEFVSLMGPSGSGKTTLMNIIGCLDVPTAGEYLLDSRDVAKLSEDDLSLVRNEYIGFIFQSFNLIADLTVLENVTLPSLYSGFENIERGREILKTVGLSERMDHYPNELSGGQRQRVAIARALINDPDILLADEPTGNLDSVSGKEVMELMRTFHRQGKTIVLVTHDEFTASFAEREIHLKDGMIVS